MGLIVELGDWASFLYFSVLEFMLNFVYSPVQTTFNIFGYLFPGVYLALFSILKGNTIQ